MGIIIAALLLIPLTVVLVVVGAIWRAWLGMLVLGIAHSYQPDYFPALGFSTCFFIALVVGMFVPTSASTTKDD